MTQSFDETITWHDVADGAVGSEVEIFLEESSNDAMSNDPLTFSHGESGRDDTLHPQ